MNNQRYKIVRRDEEHDKEVQLQRSITKKRNLYIAIKYIQR